MEIFAGGVNESDKVFGVCTVHASLWIWGLIVMQDLTAMIDEVLRDGSLPGMFCFARTCVTY